MTLLSTKIWAIVAVVLFGGASWLTASGWTTIPPAPAKPVDYGYFYRLNVKISHQDEFFDMNIVVACDPSLVPKFGMGAMTQFPRFYAERTKANHAIGVRPVLGCANVTTENGRAPPDLLPAIRWFPDADDMTFSILYATEDAYENPLSQLKFHGATMHAATVDEFLAFQEAAKTKSIVPVHGRRPILPLRPGERDYITAAEIKAMGGKAPESPLQPGELERLTHAEIEALGGKAPKPNWLQQLQCDAIAKYELSEASREIVRRYWPAHKPRFWVPNEDASDAIWKEIHRGAQMNPANPNSQYYHRNPLINDERVGDYAWDFSSPATDGLPTRTGGGALQQLQNGRAKMRNPPYKPPILYPVQYSATLPFYQTKDKNSDSPMWTRIDMRGGATQGFAYCQVQLRVSDILDGEQWNSNERLLPGYRHRPRQVYVDDELIETALPPAAGGTSLIYLPRIFERDQFMFLRASAYH
jgi:hypothetical protein